MTTVTQQTSISTYLSGSLALTQTILISSVRNVKGILISLFTPMLLLIVFTLTSGDEAVTMVPFIVGLSIMLSGQLLAQMLVMWRQQRIFQRMAVTPTPMGLLVFGVLLASWVQFFVQTLVVLVAGLIMTDLSLSVPQLMSILAALSVGIFPFLGFGALIATLTSKPDIASNMYIFILLPTVFLGGSLFEVPFFDDVGQFLPPTLFTQMLNGLFGFGSTDQLLLQLVVLMGYAIGFTIIASVRFKWD